MGIQFFRTIPQGRVLATLESPEPHLETQFAIAGCQSTDETGAVTPPIHLSTTFQREPDGSWPGGHVYSRSSNPTRSLFEETMARLEGGAQAAAFASGMAATNAVLSATGGGHLLIPTDVYHGVRHLLQTTWREWGLASTEVDYSAGWEAYIRPETTLIWIETPSNPQARITDIRAVCRVAGERGIAVVVDSTWNTPLITRPLELGASLVVHSTTKFLGGHSDVLGGVVVAGEGGQALMERIRHIQGNAGAVMDPFSAWLTLRGMRSLGARLPRQCDSADRIARYLDAHDGVDRVHYPGLTSHPGHETATRQMARFGAMVSFEVPGGRARAMEVAGRLEVFRRATSLGGTESLVEHRASIEPEPPVSPEGLLRLSLGLEHPVDLLGDLERALR